MVADGLMSRMSLTSVPVMPPSADLDAIDYDTYSEYEHLVARLVNNRPTRPHDVPLQDAARAILGEAKKGWQAQAALYDGDRLPRFSERLGKLPGLAARMAIGFATIEAAEMPGAPGMGPGEFDLPRVVTADQMHRACQYVDYQARHDLAFYAAAAGQDVTPTISMARRLAAWLLQLGRQSFQFGEITRGILEWRALKSTEQLAVLELLDHLGWVRPNDDAFFRGAQFVRGVTWLVNPAAHASFTARAESARKVAAESKRRLDEAVANATPHAHTEKL
jgi:hypothetical protein